MTQEHTVATQTRAQAPTFPAGSARNKHVPGEEGIWVLIFGDMLLFGVFFATYLYYRGREPELFSTSQLTLNLDYGAFNTLLLLTSSLFVVVGIRALRNAVRGVAPAMFVGAFLCGAGFGLIKFLEYGAKISDGITPGTNTFYMYYFVLTGLHFFHVLVGMVVLAVMFVMSRKPELTARRFGYIEGGACFWHMVDLLWIILFPLIYLAR